MKSVSKKAFAIAVAAGLSIAVAPITSPVGANYAFAQEAKIDQSHIKPQVVNGVQYLTGQRLKPQDGFYSISGPDIDPPLTIENGKNKAEHVLLVAPNGKVQENGDIKMPLGTWKRTDTKDDGGTTIDLHFVPDDPTRSLDALESLQNGYGWLQNDGNENAKWEATYYVVPTFRITRGTLDSYVDNDGACSVREVDLSNILPEGVDFKPSKDHEGRTLTPNGASFSYDDEKGVLKFDPGKDAPYALGALNYASPQPKDPNLSADSKNRFESFLNTARRINFWGPEVKLDTNTFDKENIKWEDGKKKATVSGISNQLSKKLFGYDKSMVDLQKENGGAVDTFVPIFPLDGQPKGARSEEGKLYDFKSDSNGKQSDEYMKKLDKWNRDTGLDQFDNKFTEELIVPGEGKWSYGDQDTIVFTPEEGFTGDPTPVKYAFVDYEVMNQMKAAPLFPEGDEEKQFPLENIAPPSYKNLAERMVISKVADKDEVPSGCVVKEEPSSEAPKPSSEKPKPSTEKPTSKPSETGKETTSSEKPTEEKSPETSKNETPSTSKEPAPTAPAVQPQTHDSVKPVTGGTIPAAPAQAGKQGPTVDTGGQVHTGVIGRIIAFFLG